jgi:hypothetical protein
LFLACSSLTDVLAYSWLASDQYDPDFTFSNQMDRIVALLLAFLSGHPNAVTHFPEEQLA